jgi:hypothetical protein
MQNIVTETATPAAAANVSSAKPETATPAKRATRKPAKPAAAAKPETPAAAAAAKPDNSARDAERQAASLAIAEFYAGRSLPFKSASDAFAALRLDKAPKAATQRQAALLCVMLAADTAGNIKPNGEFTRGGFRIPARLINPQAKPGDMLAVQPETGCLSDMLGRTVHYVSGPTSGKAQRETVLRVDLARAKAEISAHIGDKLAKPALAAIARLTKAA